MLMKEELWGQQTKLDSCPFGVENWGSCSCLGVGPKDHIKAERVWEEITERKQGPGDHLHTIIRSNNLAISGASPACRGSVALGKYE